jgi:hypothetical protein
MVKVSKLLSCICLMLFGIAMSAILSGPIIMIWELFHWHITSEWIPVPTEKLLVLLGLDASSVIGLGGLPVTVTMPIVGVLFIYLVIFPLLFPLIQASKIARQNESTKEVPITEAQQYQPLT